MNLSFASIAGVSKLWIVFLYLNLFIVFRDDNISFPSVTDGCEWVNVSSGTGLPGLSRIKGR